MNYDKYDLRLMTHVRPSPNYLRHPLSLPIIQPLTSPSPAAYAVAYHHCVSHKNGGDAPLFSETPGLWRYSHRAIPNSVSCCMFPLMTLISNPCILHLRMTPFRLRIKDCGLCS